MRENIREQILEAARILFDEKGYNGVSIKNIADSLGISTGNLTYYFKRKEALAEALVEKQHTAYKKLAPPRTLRQLHTYLKLILEVQQKNAYYYKHYAQFSQISPRIRQIQEEVYADLYNALSTSLEILQSDGLVGEDAISGQRRQTIDTMMILCTSGQDGHCIDRFACLWTALYPLLTEKGRRDYLEIS